MAWWNALDALLNLENSGNIKKVLKNRKQNLIQAGTIKILIIGSMHK